MYRSRPTLSFLSVSAVRRRQRPVISYTWDGRNLRDLRDASSSDRPIGTAYAETGTDRRQTSSALYYGGTRVYERRAMQSCTGIRVYGEYETRTLLRSRYYVDRQRPPSELYYAPSVNYAPGATTSRNTTIATGIRAEAAC